MNTLFILSYNNLDANFWQQHIPLDEVDKVCIFRNGSTCLNNLKLKPDMIIIDEYFAPKDSGSVTAKDIKDAALQECPDAVVFNLSPEFCNNAVRDVFHPHLQSNFNGTILSVMTEHILEKAYKAAS
ncbi:MAG: hypothetical protein HRT74_02715 [Flavobacteriales bacterium]|nr:hypothetical protein [Flavobacteriales bacterium]